MVLCFVTWRLLIIKVYFVTLKRGTCESWNHPKFEGIQLRNFTLSLSQMDKPRRALEINMLTFHLRNLIKVMGYWPLCAYLCKICILWNDRTNCLIDTRYRNVRASLYTFGSIGSLSAVKLFLLPTFYCSNCVLYFCHFVPKMQNQERRKQNIQMYGTEGC